jgi:hypothetical protein
MGFFEALIRALIYICLLAAAYFLVLWVLTGIGISVPTMIIHIFGIILALVAILILVRLFYPFFVGFSWFPAPVRRNPPPPPPR